MKLLTIITLFLLTVSCYDIDRQFKHIVNTWQLEELGGESYPEIHQWCFKKDGTFFFADGSEISEDFNYTISETELCLLVSDTECFDLLELTKKSLIVKRRDVQVDYKFKALN